MTDMGRRTRQRTTIEEVFDDAGRPLSAAEALEVAQQSLPSLGIATVYRAVNDLMEAGRLRAVELPGQPARYERADLGHHHHFSCQECGRVFDVEGCPGRIAQMAPRGFTVESHEILLYGTCADCG